MQCYNPAIPGRGALSKDYWMAINALLYSLLLLLKPSVMWLSIVSSDVIQVT